MSAQTILRETHAFDVREATGAFFEAWMSTPFRRPTGGSRFNNILWLHLISKAMRPNIIIDSGTFEGASAWALSKGAPDAETMSFDVDLSQILHREPGVHYIEHDWTAVPINAPTGSRVLAYFDDHIDQARRLLEARQLGVTIAIFDDDLPLTAFYRMAPTTAVLPKIEFVLDDSLRDGQILEWNYRGTCQRFVIDRAYLNRARAVIEASERLPPTGLITGIYQTPYRIVRLAE